MRLLKAIALVASLAPWMVRAPHLYPATIRITSAQFVSPTGVRIEQTAPITLTAIVGAFSG